MKSAAILLGTAIMASTALAQPKHMRAHLAQHAKREVQVITKTDYYTEVVVDYTTIYVTPGQATPAPATPSAPVVQAVSPAPAAAQEKYAPQQQAPAAPSVPVVNKNPNNANDAVFQDQKTTLVTTTTPPAPVSTPAVPVVQQPSAGTSSAAPAKSGAASGSLLSYGFPPPSSASGTRVTECTSSACEGWATFFDTSNTMACGYDPVDPSQHVVALPLAWMNNPSNSGTNKPIDPNCGRVVEITCSKTGNTLQAVVVDGCPVCVPGTGHIDLSRGAYKALGVSEDVGTPSISWKFLS